MYFPNWNSLALSARLNILATLHSMNQKIMYTVDHFIHVSVLRSLSCAEFFGFFHSQEFTIQYDLLWDFFFFFMLPSFVRVQGFVELVQIGVCNVNHESFQ